MSTVFLVNCMDEDVHVLVDGEPQLLPRGIIPVLLTKPVRPMGLTVSVIDMDNTSEPATSDMLLYTSEEAIGVLDLPPYIPGVWNLVAPDALVQFPWRDDFVTPAVWEYVGDLDETGDDATGSDPDDDMDDEDVFDGLVLAGVTRAPVAVATQDMPVLDR